MGNRCALCGGKLKNGICIDCGMDNRKSDTDYEKYEQKYGKSASGQAKENVQIKPDIQKGKTVSAVYERSPVRSSAGAASGYENGRTQATAGVRRRTKKAENAQTAWKRRLVLAIALPLLGFGIKKMLEEPGKKAFVKPMSEKINIPLPEAVTDSLDSIVQKKEEESLIVELLWEQLEGSHTPDEDKGVEIETKIFPGEYIVGKDIPEGVYEIEAVNGGGIVFIDEGENYSRLSEYLLSEKIAKELDYHSEDYTSRLFHLPLIDGSSIYVEGDLELLLKSECAREDLLKERLQNPLKESFTIKEEQMIMDTEKASFYVAGKDFPAGVYDIVFREGMGFGRWIREDKEEDSLLCSFELNKESPVLHHIRMKEGTKIALTSQGSIELVPSEYGE